MQELNSHQVAFTVFPPVTQAHITPPAPLCFLPFIVVISLPVYPSDLALSFVLSEDWSVKQKQFPMVFTLSFL